MRAVWLLAAGCAADPIPVPPIPDQIVQVVTATVGTGNSRDGAAIRDDRGDLANQLGMAFESFQSAELYPTLTMDVQLGFADDVLTLIDHGVASAPTPLQEDDGKVVAGGATATLTLHIGAESVAFDLTDATVRLDPVTLNGALGGIVPTEQKLDRLVPAAVRALNAQVAKDCHALMDPADKCGCTEGSNGIQILGVLTTDLHCVLTDQDLTGSGLLASVIFDDMPTGISFGTAITTEQL